MAENEVNIGVESEEEATIDESTDVDNGVDTEQEEE